MVEDIETYGINADMKYMVLSDACSNEQNTEEKTKVLNIERCGNLTEPVCHDGIDSSEICKKMASAEALIDNKVNRAH